MSYDETLAAATSFVRGLARNAAPSYNPPEFIIYNKSATVTTKALLPGGDTDFKASLETELSALAARVRFLENKASTVNHQILPDTPGEFGAPTSPFANGSTGVAQQNGVRRPVRQLSANTRQARVSDLLAGNTLTFTEENIGDLRDHVEQQAQKIKSQADRVNVVEEQLVKAKEHSSRSMEDMKENGLGPIEREMSKLRQTNMAFGKAIKEIGTIITNVANGDLSQRVQIHATEMDPDIATFKRTINTMMDQLQVFGNEVSRVAREVGTEGKLGGQAQVTGVSGIWADLTQNGELQSALRRSESLANYVLPQSIRWLPILLFRSEKLQGHHCCGARKSRAKDSATGSRRNSPTWTNHQYYGGSATHFRRRSLPGRWRRRH